MTDKEAMKLALDALETEVSIDWTNNDEFNASAEKMHEAIAALKERLADHMREVQRLGQEIEQEPVAWISPSGALYRTRYHAVANAEQSLTPLYTAPPQRTWIGLEGAEFGWFCHTDFLNARKYTKKQRQHICCQLLSEAQSWDIEEYQLMMHDSTKIKENT